MIFHTNNAGNKKATFLYFDSIHLLHGYVRFTGVNTSLASPWKWLNLPVPALVVYPRDCQRQGKKRESCPTCIPISCYSAPASNHFLVLEPVPHSLFLPHGHQRGRDHGFFQDRWYCQHPFLRVFSSCFSQFTCFFLIAFYLTDVFSSSRCTFFSI
ncbi:MAG: hypothetical protein ACFFD4_04470 [Candidatus Odinarchaeota archaeon]